MPPSRPATCGSVFCSAQFPGSHAPLVEGAIAAAFRPVHHQNIMGLHAFNSHQYTFDLGGEDVDPTDDEHVVGAAADPFHAHMSATALADLRKQTGDIAGPIAYYRKRLLGDGGENQFPQLPVGQHRLGFRVDDFGDEVVLENVQAVFGLFALVGNPRADDLACRRDKC